MLHGIIKLNNLRLLAIDGEIGRCKDFLFDDRPWVVRYMVADTGTWLPGRKVLILPASLGKPDWSANLLSVQLLKKQIENAPGLGSDAPVSRQYEVAYHSFYGMPYYWSEPEAPAEIVDPAPLITEGKPAIKATPGTAKAHLRSAEEVIGYSIQATDGELGHVEDFILDDETWYIRYLVVATRNWPPNKKFMVTPAQLGEVDWTQGTVSVHMTKEQLQKCPEYDSSAPINSGIY